MLQGPSPFETTYFRDVKFLLSFLVTETTKTYLSLTSDKIS